MSKLTASTDFDRLEKEELAKFLAKFGDQVVQLLNGNLDFTTNFNCKLLSVTFSVANANTAVPHGLNRVPVGYFITSRSASVIVYDGTSANTSTTLNVRASAMGSVNLIVF